MNDITALIVALLTGLATAIPLVIKLVEYCQKAIKEKNWSRVLELVQSLIVTAENKFDNGGDKKEWVMEQVKSSAKTINYDIDMEAISKLIDSLIALTKKVNVSNE